MSGVCLDRVSAAVADVPYYGALSARIRKEGAGVVFFNHGAYPDEAYARHADLLGTFEDRGPLTGASQCRAGRQRGQPRSSITWCTRCRPRDSARLPSLPYSVVRHLFTSLSAAGPTRMIACLLIAGNEMPRSTGSSRSRGRAWSWPAWLVVVAAAVAACSSGGPPARARPPPPRARPPPSEPVRPRPDLPATGGSRLLLPVSYLGAGRGQQAGTQQHDPGYLRCRRGDGPVAHFQAVVRQARARNITVLGYISTVDGQRPVRR